MSHYRLNGLTITNIDKDESKEEDVVQMFVQNSSRSMQLADWET